MIRLRLCRSRLPGGTSPLCTSRLQDGALLNRCVRSRSASGTYLLAVLIALLIAAPLRAADPPKLDAAKLKQRAQEAIRTGAVQYKPANNRIEGQRDDCRNGGHSRRKPTLTRKDPSPAEIFYDQVEIELLRKDLLRRQSSHQIMEPYYKKAEAIIAKSLAVAQDPKLTDDARNDQLFKLDGEQSDALQGEGLTAVAKSIGMELPPAAASGAAPGHDVKLVAAKGATIDMVRQTTASLLHDVGKPEKDFPWTSYQQGDTATLSGNYYCRIRLNGKEATFNKRVGPKTDELDFPNP